jgi:very-short-patch-repair endonuclease
MPPAEVFWSMRDLVLDLQSVGGIARHSTLRALGHTKYHLSSELKAGRVIHPGRGWLAVPSAHRSGLRAVALGGRLGAANALDARGIWVDTIVGLTVHVAVNAARLKRLGPDERRTRRRVQFDARSGEWCVSTMDALIQLSHEMAPAPWLTSVDNALHVGAIGPGALDELEPFIPRPHRKLLGLADAKAESGNETLMRLILIEAGFSVESQVKIAGVGFVDLLVDGWLIVEMDSHEFHGHDVDQDNDRSRDGNALLGGRDTVRFMPTAVRKAPEWCLSVIRARLRQGRASPKSGREAAPRHVSS